MIKNFKHKGLEQFFTKDNRRLLDVKDLPRITRILDRLDAAILANDMNIPGWDFHELKGERKGVWSVLFVKTGKLLSVLKMAMPMMLTLRIITNEYYKSTRAKTYSSRCHLARGHIAILKYDPN